MPYVYRYIDMNKDEVVYVGKVTKEKQGEYDPLKNRHLQHKREEWYKEIGFKDLCMQYIEVASPVDADIYESFLISYYNTGQLVNKAKTGWGNSRLKIDIINPKRWMLYDDTGHGFENIMQAIRYGLDLSSKYPEFEPYNPPKYPSFDDENHDIRLQEYENYYKEYDRRNEPKRKEHSRIMDEHFQIMEYEETAQYIEMSIILNEDFRRKEKASKWGYKFRHPFETMGKSLQAAVS